MLKTMTVRTTIAAFLAGLSMSAHAIADTQRIDIPAGSLLTALETLAKQANVDLVYQDAQIKGLRTGGVAGELSPHDAVVKLLQGTPLKVRRDEASGAILITIPPAGAPAASSLSPTPSPQNGEGQGEDKKSFWSRLRLAQTDTLSTSQVGAQNPSPSKGEGQGEDERPAQRQKVIELEEIIVTGSHIRGVAPTSETITFDRTDIDRTGHSTVEALMRTLPQNFSEISPEGRFATEGGSIVATRNNDRVTSVNLRGLGAQSTLALVDGVRQPGSIGGRVFDVSALPLSMVERVDVVNGGHSAVYGSDAVAGVVNFITRREFDGLQTQITYGGAADGGERLHLSQMGGLSFTRGGFAVGYEYSQEWPFDLADAGLLANRPLAAAGGLTPVGLQAQADSKKHSAFLSGHYSATDVIELFANAIYTRKTYEDLDRRIYAGATAVSALTADHPSDFYSAAAGARIYISTEWQLAITGSSGETDIESKGIANEVFATSSRISTSYRHDTATVRAISAVADGPILRIPTGEVRLAAGAEFRTEDFANRSTFNGINAAPNERDREIESVFGEMIVPIVGLAPSESKNRLELSLAGRYDDYSDVGGTFNPQFGVAWRPTTSIALRAGYSKSFRAPALAEQLNTASAFIVPVADPRSSTGTTPLIILGGDNPDLEPERARGWNFGIEFTPKFLSSSTFSINYFDVEYTDRIEVPAVGFSDRLAALTREDRYAQLINRSPTAGGLQSVLNTLTSFFNFTPTAFGSCPASAVCQPNAVSLIAAFPTVAIFDDRTNNIAIDKVRGLDFTGSAEIPTEAGDITVGFNVAYTLDQERNVTATSPTFDLLNEVGKPVDFRARVNLGWSRGPFALFSYINYTDSYDNPFSTPRSRMPSWTTVDLSLTVDGSEISGAPFLQGIGATVAVQNALDKTPPRYENSNFGVLYDTTNANPFGRYISLRVAKSW